MDTSYKVFVHLEDDADQIVTQIDREPQAGEAPTTGWLANEVISDEILLPLSENMEQVRRINVGLYNPVDGERLQVVNSDQMTPDTFVSIELEK
jgi:hypothetical protein